MTRPSPCARDTVRQNSCSTYADEPRFPHLRPASAQLSLDILTSPGSCA